MRAMSAAVSIPPGLPCTTTTGAPVPTTAYSIGPSAVSATLGVYSGAPVVCVSFMACAPSGGGNRGRLRVLTDDAAGNIRHCMLRAFSRPRDGQGELTDVPTGSLHQG